MTKPNSRISTVSLPFNRIQNSKKAKNNVFPPLEKAFKTARRALRAVGGIPIDSCIRTTQMFRILSRTYYITLARKIKGFFVKIAENNTLILVILPFLRKLAFVFRLQETSGVLLSRLSAADYRRIHIAGLTPTSSEFLLTPAG